MVRTGANGWQFHRTSVSDCCISRGETRLVLADGLCYRASCCQCRLVSVVERKYVMSLFSHAASFTGSSLLNQSSAAIVDQRSSNDLTGRILRAEAALAKLARSPGPH